MKQWKPAVAAVVAALVLGGVPRAVAAPGPEAQGGGALSPAYLDQLLAPVALYPDALLAQVLLCSGNASKVGELSAWLKQMSKVKGSALQEAAQKAGFEPSFVALAPFPQVVELMAGNLQWTSQLGGAFAVDRAAVFESIQRLRKQSHAAGNLKTTPQQTVETRTTEGGEQVIVIEPANPQVVYVPQYNPQVVYTQPAQTTVVVQEDDDEEEAAIAGAVIGFAAGVAIGAAIDNDYYYGPYGWHGGVHMYNDAWDDWYDDREDAREDWYENREDAREDWQDHREDTAGERSDRAQNAQEQRTERQEARSGSEAQAQRAERQEARGSPEAQAQRDQRRTEAQGRAQEARATGASPQTQSASASSSGSRARGGERSSAAERSGTRSDAFSGYSSGRSTRSESSRGQRSRSGGGRSRRR
jgi:hypothetical protein